MQHSNTWCESLSFPYSEWVRAFCANFLLVLSRNFFPHLRSPLAIGDYVWGQKEWQKKRNRIIHEHRKYLSRINLIRSVVGYVNLFVALMVSWRAALSIDINGCMRTLELVRAFLLFVVVSSLLFHAYRKRARRRGLEWIFLYDEGRRSFSFHFLFFCVFLLVFI